MSTEIVGVELLMPPSVDRHKEERDGGKAALTFREIRGTIFMIGSVTRRPRPEGSYDGVGGLRGSPSGSADWDASSSGCGMGTTGRRV
jgi:hypothetical protein